MINDMWATQVGLGAYVLAEFFAHALNHFPIDIRALFLAKYVAETLTKCGCVHVRILGKRSTDAMSAFHPLRTLPFGLSW